MPFLVRRSICCREHNRGRLMAVDLKRGETLPIHINMTFPSLPCDVLSVDAIDLSGKHEVDLDTNIWKLHLNRDGHILGSVYISDLVEKEQETQKQITQILT